ncbi:UNVERIFIED_CONTAM: hypothetical protein RMT77_008424 [Armadillidium vulgare]
MDFEALFQRCQDVGIKRKEAKEFGEKALERHEREKEREALERGKEREALEREKEREALERGKEREALEREKERVEREKEREEREKKREALEREKERVEREKERENEIRMLELQNSSNENISPETNSFRTKTPKLPPFSDNIDETDCYLERFERLAEINGWERNDWASHLSALLTGSALIVYSRMSREDSKVYDKLKHSLLTRYNLTEEGYRSRFRNSKPLANERPIQFVERLRNYLNKWTELSLTPKTFEGLSDLILSEQFMNTYPRDVAVFLRERNVVGIDRLSQETENYLMARDRNCSKATTKYFIKENEHNANNTNTDLIKEKWTIMCYKCGNKGHRVSECRSQSRNKFSFEKGTTIPQWRTYGNRTRPNNWREEPKKEVVSLSINDKFMRDDERLRVTSHLSTERTELANYQEVSSCVEGNRIMLACGKAIPFVKMACVRTGKRMKMLLIDNSIRDVPVAKIRVTTPYYEGEVEALALQDAIYELIIGNISGAKAPNNPLPCLSPSCAAARENQYGSNNEIQNADDQGSSQENPCGKITKEDLIHLQEEDESLNKCRSLIHREKRKDEMPYYIMKGGVLQRIIQKNGDYIEQIVVPKRLRHHLISMAHDIIMGGHLGIKKTTDKLITGFYWPGINEDVSRFCHLCDIC